MTTEHVVDSIESLATGLYTQDCNARHWTDAPDAVRDNYRAYAERLIQRGVVRPAQDLLDQLADARHASTRWAHAYHELEKVAYRRAAPAPRRRPWHQRALDAVLGPKCAIGCGTRLFPRDEETHYTTNDAGDPRP